MSNLESGSAVLVIRKIAKEGTKADGPEDDIPVGVNELEDSLGAVRAQVKATRGLRKRHGDDGNERSSCQHRDGEGQHPGK